VANGAGVPLTVIFTTANAHDSKAFEEWVDAIEPIKGPEGDRGSDPRSYTPTRPRTPRSTRIRFASGGIKSRTARKAVETRRNWPPPMSGGAHAGVGGEYRRLAVRYERRADIHEAFLPLSCSLICLN